MISQLINSSDISMQLPLWMDAQVVVRRYRVVFKKKRQVAVTLAMVLEYIQSANGYVTTQQISDSMSTNEKVIPERSVRAAVTWLIFSGYLEKSGEPIIRKANGQPYKVWLYKWTGKDTPLQEIRQDANEREVQKWNDKYSSGVLLQNIFMSMGSRSALTE